MQHLGELRSLSRGRRSPHGAALLIASWAQSVVDLIDGDPAAAFHRLNRFAGQDAPDGHQIVKTALFCHFAEAAAKAGEPALLRQELPRFEAWAGRTTGPTWPALAARSRALLSDDDDQVDEAYREAQRLHLLGCSELERARTDLLYGQWLRRRRQPRAARAVLQSAWETFEQVDAPGWAAQAAAELRASGDRHPAAHGVAQLTAQQHRIALLAGSGASNQEIADQLYLSVRTVEYHLGRIFTRLGLRSRVELAALDL
jgi:DNA-binding CsgD family transcriptional regulator